MSLILRPLQEDMLSTVRQHIRGGAKRVLIQAPCGFGKTVLAAKIMQGAALKGNRAFFNVHRRELLKQSVATLRESADIAVGVVAAGFPDYRFAQTQVCSIDSLSRRLHLLPKPSMMLWDESHHIAAASYSKIFNQYPDIVHIGLTATPQRLDGAGLDKFFDVMVKGPAIAALIEQGWLSDYVLYAPSKADMSGVRSIGGDYHKGDLNKAMQASRVTGDVVLEYKRRAGGKRAIAFAWSIESSKDIARRFREAGIPAEHVDGATDDNLRDGAMRRFIRGDTLVLCNVDLFGEGVDVPAVEAVIMLNPTRSLTKYLQQIGRALRIFPGKDRAVILDHAGNSDLHGLPDDDRDWSLDGIVKNRKKDAEPGIKQCPACFAHVRSISRACRHCQFEFVIKGRPMDVVEGELAAVDLAAMRQNRRTQVGRARDEASLKAIAAERGYKQGWVDHIMRARGQ